MKISLGSWAFSFGPYADDPVPFDRTAERLAQAGYDGIEVCGFPPHVTLETYPDRGSRRELVGFLDGLGLGVSGYAADFTPVNPVTPGNARRYLELFRQNLELAVDIGSPSIRVDTGAAPGSIDERDYQASFDRLAEIWHEAASLAGEAGVRLVWEFEPGFAFNKPSEIVALHRQVAHQNFYILFDTAHAYMCAVVGARQHGARETLTGGIGEFVNRLEGRIGAIHLNDSDGTLYGDETSAHRPFGTGRIDFLLIVPQLLAIREVDWWCVDMCFCAQSWELVEPSLAFVQRLLHPRMVTS